MTDTITKPAPIAITMGESAGVGPEIICKLWQNRKKHKLPEFFVLGLSEAFKAVAPDVPIKEIAEPFETKNIFDTALPLIVTGASKQAVEPGQLNSSHAAATISAIDQAVSYCLSGQARAVVTGPIDKHHLQMAGFDSPGHTEYLSKRCNLPSDHSVMMLSAEDLRVVLATVHIPLMDIAKQLNPNKIIHVTSTLFYSLRNLFNITNPRIAIAGLNPHAGENGLLGGEEDLIIKPAMWALADMGITVDGPKSADSLFHAEARKNYDGIVCMYHDQALIPIKTIDFWGGVNTTLGLPIIRTSPDHGTALDIAGKDIARTDSFLEAIRMADKLSSVWS